MELNSWGHWGTPEPLIIPTIVVMVPPNVLNMTAEQLQEFLKHTQRVVIDKERAEALLSKCHVIHGWNDIGNKMVDALFNLYTSKPKLFKRKPKDVDRYTYFYSKGYTAR